MSSPNDNIEYNPKQFNRPDVMQEFEWYKGLWDKESEEFRKNNRPAEARREHNIIDKLPIFVESGLFEDGDVVRTKQMQNTTVLEFIDTNTRSMARVRFDKGISQEDFENTVVMRLFKDAAKIKLQNEKAIEEESK